MMSPDDLRQAIKGSRLSVSAIAGIAGLPRTTLYSFVTGDTKSLRASAQLAVQEALGLKRTQAVREDPAPFEHDLRSEAKALGLDADAIAIRAVAEAIKRKRIEAWIDEHKEAFAAHRKDIEENGLWSDGLRMF